MATSETETETETQPEPETQPLVRILRGGEPAPDELAALTAVLLARAATTAEAEEAIAADEEEVRVVPLWERTGPAAAPALPYRSPVSWRN
ncbi:acyl-CoA carboxylase epsilon subunit [Streptomyces sp. CA-249302]|uniref:acyl-CoA carboxylase epsilon subunit n=1 Tax=Streptomyces sp. CA-249302 TaxID=3240058 RepID=UPI003D89D5A8